MSFNNSQDQNEEQKKLEPLSRYKKAPLIVLNTVGNSSYMTSVVQCLANIHSIINYYLAANNDFKKKAQKFPISYGFSKIIFRLYPFPEDDLDKSLSIKAFQRAIAYFNHCFKGDDCRSAIYFWNIC